MFLQPLSDTDVSGFSGSYILPNESGTSAISPTDSSSKLTSSNGHSLIPRRAENIRHQSLFPGAPQSIITLSRRSTLKSRWSPRASRLSDLLDAGDVERPETIAITTTARFRLGSGPLTIQNDEKSSERADKRPTRQVDLQLLRRGLFKFRFLLDCGHPGSVPDASMLAALLDLVCPSASAPTCVCDCDLTSIVFVARVQEAPVLSRAAILVECAHSVQRCARGDWPAWLKHVVQGAQMHAPLAASSSYNLFATGVSGSASNPLVAASLWRTGSLWPRVLHVAFAHLVSAPPETCSLRDSNYLREAKEVAALFVKNRQLQYRLLAALLFKSWAEVRVCAFF